LLAPAAALAGAPSLKAAAIRAAVDARHNHAGAAALGLPLGDASGVAPSAPSGRAAAALVAVPPRAAALDERAGSFGLGRRRSHGGNSSSGNDGGGEEGQDDLRLHSEHKGGIVDECNTE
jgi:hypothetical protein